MPLWFAPLARSTPTAAMGQTKSFNLRGRTTGLRQMRTWRSHWSGRGGATLFDDAALDEVCRIFRRHVLTIKPPHSRA